MRVSQLSKAALAFLVLLPAFNASAQQSGTFIRPVRILVPYPPGGAVDVIARTLSPKLTASMGQQIIVENRPGASGIIASEALINYPPDGHAFIIVISSHSVNPSLYKKLPYDTLSDFAPLTLIGAGPNVVSVHPSLPVKSVKQLVALAKAHPKDFNYAHFGAGSSSHLSGELFNILAKVTMVGIPYKGAGPGVTAVIGGHVLLMFGNMPVSLPHVKSGKLRALAVTSAGRSPAAPDLPTVAESGLPGYETGEWWGALAHGKTRPELVKRLNEEIVKALADPQVKERLSALGAELAGTSSEDFDAFIRQQMDKWGRVVKQAGIQPG